MSKYFKFIYLIFILLCPHSALSDDSFAQLRESRPIILHRRTRFINPNELQPSDGTEIFDRAPAGLLVGVGAERIYYAYILARQATHVLAIDHDRDIIQFHQINDLLMRMTPPAAREIYRKLRFTGALEFWIRQARWAADYGRLTESEFARIKAGPLYDWWQKKIVRQRKATWGLESSEKTNYLEYDPAFRRLQSLFEHRRFQAHHLELNREVDVDDLVRALEVTGLPLSFLDLSNSAMQNYVTGESLRRLLRAFAAIADSESLIVATSLHFGSNGRPFTSYLGIKFRALSLYPELIPKMIGRFSDGREFNYPLKKLVIDKTPKSICDELMNNINEWDIRLIRAPQKQNL